MSLYNFLYRLLRLRDAGSGGGGGHNNTVERLITALQKSHAARFLLVFGCVVCLFYPLSINVTTGGMQQLSVLLD